MAPAALVFWLMVCASGVPASRERIPPICQPPRIQAPELSENDALDGGGALSERGGERGQSSQTDRGHKATYY
ncbi:MAG: hypothetical protein R2729_10010 [Bryobacteraceae bacterium]